MPAINMASLLTEYLAPQEGVCLDKILPNIS